MSRAWIRARMVSVTVVSVAVFAMLAILLRREAAIPLRWRTARDGKGGGQFTTVAGLAVDSQGHISTGESFGHRVQQLSPNGKLLALWGSVEGVQPGQFFHPTGNAADGQDNVYVVDRHRVQKLTPEGGS